MEDQVRLDIENKDGKVYVTFFDPSYNYIAGSVAVANASAFGRLSPELKYNPKELLLNFIRNGYMW